MPRSFYSFLLRSHQDVVYITNLIENHNRRHDVGEKLAPAYALVYRGYLIWRISNHGGERLSTAFINQYISSKEHDTAQSAYDTTNVLLMWPFGTPDMLPPLSNDGMPFVVSSQRSGGVNALAKSTQYDRAWSNPPFTHLFFDHRMYLALDGLPTRVNTRAFNTQLRLSDPHLWQMVTSSPPKMTPRDVLAHDHDCLGDLVGRGFRISQTAHRNRFGELYLANGSEHQDKGSSDSISARHSVGSGLCDFVAGNESWSRVAEYKAASRLSSEQEPAEISIHRSETTEEEGAYLLLSLRFPNSSFDAITGLSGITDSLNMSAEDAISAYEMPLIFSCNVCGKLTGLRCLGCMKTFFCSPECQESDIHSAVCAVICETNELELSQEYAGSSTRRHSRSSRLFVQ